MSLDGYIADGDGNFDWAEPDEAVHRLANDLERSVGTHLYGRRMYEVMSAWKTLQSHDQPPYIADFASIWRGADKVVYSASLQAPSTPKTRIERRFDPEAVRRMKAAAEKDLTIGGPTLAAQAFKAGLVDVCHLFICPILVGDGLNAFPDGVRVALALEEERRFGNGTVYLRYRSVNSQAA